MKHLHYISPYNNNPYHLIVHIKFNDQSDLFQQIYKIYNIDYIELSIKLEPKLYPYFPPTIEITKPNMSL